MTKQKNRSFIKKKIYFKEKNVNIIREPTMQKPLISLTGKIIAHETLVDKKDPNKIISFAFKIELPEFKYNQYGETINISNPYILANISWFREGEAKFIKDLLDKYREPYIAMYNAALGSFTDRERNRIGTKILCDPGCIALSDSSYTGINSALYYGMGSDFIDQKEGTHLYKVTCNIPNSKYSPKDIYTFSPNIIMPLYKDSFLLVTGQAIWHPVLDKQIIITKQVVKL